MLLDAWKSSLELAAPRRLFRFCISTIKNVLRGLFVAIKNFWWILGLQIIFASMLGYALWKVADSVPMPQTAHSIIEFFSALHNIAQLVLVLIVFLIMRQESDQDITSYILRKAPHVVIFHFWTNIIVMLGFMSLLNLGITNFPQIPETITLIFDFFIWMQLLFWLERRPSALNYFFSLERTANIICYNIPFIVMIFCVALLLNLLTHNVSAFLMPFVQSAHQTLPTAASIILSIKKTIATSLFALCIKSLWVAVIISFYRRKRNDEYTQLIFKS